MAESLVQNCGCPTGLALLVERSQTVRADVQLLLLALIDDRPLGDIRHKASVHGVHRMASAVTVQGTLAANIASLCHN